MLNKKCLELLEDNFNWKPDIKTVAVLEKWREHFLNYNAHTNLMSEGDVNFLFEKHVFDSLAILLWENFKPNIPKKILDVGTGGGFPSVILAICFPELEIIANDSKIKKIKFIMEIKDELRLENLKVSYSRVEDLEPLRADIITARAVASIDEIKKLALKHLKQDGHFVFYKGRNYEREFSRNDDEKALILPYTLPTDEEHKRFIIVLGN